MDSSAELIDLMSQLGNFGKYQLIQHFLHSLAWLTAAVHMMSFVFVFPIMEHRCYIEEVDGIEVENESITLDLDSFAGIDVYIPKNLKGVLDSCHKYGANNTTIACDDGYVFNSTYFSGSRVEDFDLVCENDWMRAVLQSVFLCGTLFGALICGQLADKFGRKPIFCISALLQCAFGVVGVYLENYVTFAICMFGYGLFGASGSVVPSVALSMEVVGGSARAVCGTMLTVWFGVGAVATAAWAYFLTVEPHHLQLIYALHSVILFGHFWLMDESICWLWTNNQKEKAVKIAEKAVRINGGEFVNRYTLSKEQPDESKADSPTNKQDIPDQKKEKENSPSSSALDLFRFPKLRLRTLVMMYCWFASSLSYFGLSFNSVNLLGNPFAMFIINIAVEIPGHFLSIFVTPKTGNKPIFSFSLLYTGVSCIVVGLLSGGLTSNILVMMAKVTATVAFNVINNYTAELFPTCLRNTAIGICIMAARSGAAIIPEINLLTSAAEEIPTITFGSVGVLAGLFSFFLLPETMKKTIPQTIQDVETPKKEERNDKIALNCLQCTPVVVS